MPLPPDKPFWERVARSGPKILALDYDGTLAQFQVDRMAARPLPVVPKLLHAILDQGSTRVAIVSGRPWSELEELLSSLASRLVLIGEHGWEWRDPGKAPVRKNPLRSIQARLLRARELAIALGSKELQSPEEASKRIETKRASIAVHVRGMEEPQASQWLNQVRRNWQDLADSLLEILEFNGGLELRATTWDKGKAVKELIKRSPQTGLLVYVGDDATDEDVFRTLPEIGIGIRVGERPENTAAQFVLADSFAVQEFLSRWERGLRQSSTKEAT